MYIPAVVQPRPSDKDRMFLLIAANDGKNFIVLETAEAYARLEKQEHSANEIAERVGKSITHVLRMLKLSKFPEEAKELIRSKKIAATKMIAEFEKFKGMANTQKFLP